MAPRNLKGAILAGVEKITMITAGCTFAGTFVVDYWSDPVSR
jgi:hypothetical protein